MAAGDTDKPRIAYLGLGVMGNGMACRLVEAGYQLAVYNRTREKADEIAERVADTPADAAR